MHVLQEIRKRLTQRLDSKATYRLGLIEQEALQRICATLDRKQKESLNAVGWLLYGPRGSGRSWVMACAAVVNALNNPGMTFTIYDHMGSRHLYVDQTFSEVDRILDRLPHQISHKFVLMRKPIHTIRYGRS